MEPIIFATYVTDENWLNICAKPLEKSFKYFHPDVPFRIFLPNEVNGKFSVDPQANIRNLKPLLGKQLRDQYKKVILLDADQIVVGPLNRIMEEDFDIVGIRNNTDWNTAGGMQGFCTPQISWQMYVNGGLTGIANYSAWDKWDHLNRNHLPGVDDEQSTFNELFYHFGYKSSLLDPIESLVHYGVSAPAPSWVGTFMEGDKIMIDMRGYIREMKIFHPAGGGYIAPCTGKFSLDEWFPKDVSIRIKEIIK